MASSGQEEKIQTCQQFSRSLLHGENGEKPDKADAHAEPFAPVHFFFEVEVGEEGGEEGAEAIDETSLCSGEVLQAPELKGIGQINTKDGQEAKAEKLSAAEFKGGFGSV